MHISKSSGVCSVIFFSFIIIMLYLFLCFLSYHFLCSFCSLHMFFFLSICCIFYILFSLSAVPHSFSAYTSVVFSCFFLSLPDTLSLLSICMEGSEIPSEVEWPQEEKNLVSIKKPALFFLKSKNSGQRAFPCILFPLLLSVAVSLCWN